MNRLRHLFSSAVSTLALLALTVPVAAAPVQHATYAQFEELVRKKALQIPELQTLWTWNMTAHKPAYFGGGALRGLLGWIEFNLRTHSVEEVLKLPVPPIEQLTHQKEADLDLTHEYLTREVLEVVLPEYAGWDLLNNNFRALSLKAGGPSLEKIWVNPNRLIDPHGGLYDFYRGKLTYVDAHEVDFEPLRGDKLLIIRNSKIALALRTLRFLNDLPSLELKEKNRELLLRTIKWESERVKPDNYWIRKSLRKLYLSTNQDTSKTLATLREFGLLSVLARNGYGLGELKAKTLQDRRPLILEIPPTEIQAEDRAAFGTIGEKVDGMEVGKLLGALDHWKTMPSESLLPKLSLDLQLAAYETFEGLSPLAGRPVDKFAARRLKSFAERLEAEIGPSAPARHVILREVIGSAISAWPENERSQASLAIRSVVSEADAQGRFRLGEFARTYLKNGQRVGYSSLFAATVAGVTTLAFVNPAAIHPQQLGLGTYALGAIGYGIFGFGAIKGTWNEYWAAKGKRSSPSLRETFRSLDLELSGSPGSSSALACLLDKLHDWKTQKRGPAP